MSTLSFLRRSLVLLPLIACLTITGCRQKVMLVPADDDLVVLNGCVISACNYLAVVKTQHSLDQNFWAKILLVRYQNHPAGHAYCVWETDGTIYGYDRNAGSFPIPIYTREPKVIASVLADGFVESVEGAFARCAGRFRRADASLRLYKF